MTAGPGVFEGLRLLEFGSGAAGPVASRYFAEQGANVVRVESTRAPDFLRVLWLTPDSSFGLDGSPMFHLLNPDKRSLCLDMKTEDGIALARRMVLEWADVVSENFAPGPMAKWGLDGPTLLEARPELVMISACLYGQTGPQRGYPGFGGQGSALSGFNHLTGWPDREAHGPAHTITDSLSPRYVALAVAAALFEKRHSGRGRFIDLSQIEAAVYSESEVVVRYSASGEIVTRQGNADDHAAPHGVYPCRGEDRWIAIACLGDADWQALRGALGDPAWAHDERYASLEGRLEARALLDDAIGAWTATFDAHALMQQLQAAGVPAGVVQGPDDLIADPQLAHRGHWVEVEHDNLGPLLVERPGFRLSDNPGGYTSPGPNLGAHTDEVLREALDLPDAELTRLHHNRTLT